MRVLIADDDVDGGATLGVLFECAGWDVRVVRGGSEAVTLGRDFRPDFVILDINMPGMDGFEAADRMRQEVCAKAAVYVAYTALNADAMAGRMKTSSFDEYLQKPVEFARFEAIFASNISFDGQPSDQRR